MSRRGEVNGYRCDRCGETTYIVHVDDGVTPMFLGCRATDGCEGMATSLMYPVLPPSVGVAWEWYSPGPPPKRRFDFGSGRLVTPPDPLTPDERKHVSRGGLLLRELTAEGQRALRRLTGEDG